MRFKWSVHSTLTINVGNYILGHRTRIHILRRHCLDSGQFEYRSWHLGIEICQLFHARSSMASHGDFWCILLWFLAVWHQPAKMIWQWCVSSGCVNRGCLKVFQRFHLVAFALSDYVIINLVEHFFSDFAYWTTAANQSSPTKSTLSSPHVVRPKNVPSVFFTEGARQRCNLSDFWHIVSSIMQGL